MKHGIWLSITLGLAGCAHSNIYREDHTLVPLQSGINPNQQYEIGKIDSTLEEINRQYLQASSAISVNDAEKVYLQRFATDLQNRRSAICRDSLIQSEPYCR